MAKQSNRHFINITPGLQKIEEELMKQLEEAESQIFILQFTVKKLRDELRHVSGLLRAWDPAHDGPKAFYGAKASTWDERLKYLKEYYHHNGHTNVPRDYLTKDRFKLGSWVSNLRRLYAAGSISEDHVNDLQNLGFNPDDHPERDFENVIAQLFLENGGVFRIRDLEKQLKVMNYPIPGRGTAANILTRLRRAKNRFARVGVGRYALLPIQNLPQFLALEKEFIGSKKYPDLRDMIIQEAFTVEVSWKCNNNEKHGEYNSSIGERLFTSKCSQCRTNNLPWNNWAKFTKGGE